MNTVEIRYESRPQTGSLPTQTEDMLSWTSASQDSRVCVSMSVCV